MKANDQATLSFEAQLDAYSASRKNRSSQSMSAGSVAGYCASTAAIFAMGTTEAEAVITIVDVNAVVNPVSNGSVGAFSLDIAGFGDPVQDFGFQGILNFAANDNRDYIRMGANNGNRIVGSVYSAFFNYAERLTMSALLSSGASFLPSNNTVDTYLVEGGFTSDGGTTFPPGGDWLDGQTGYLGFQLDNGGDKHLGWIEIRTEADNASYEIIRYGIETDPSVTEITVGVPEPSSLAYLAAGAAGLLGLRKRRGKAA